MTIYQLLPRIVVESFDPALPAALAWSAAKPDERKGMEVAFVAGAQFERERLRQEVNDEPS